MCARVHRNAPVKSAHPPPPPVSCFLQGTRDSRQPKLLGCGFGLFVLLKNMNVFDGLEMFSKSKVNLPAKAWPQEGSRASCLLGPCSAASGSLQSPPPTGLAAASARPLPPGCPGSVTDLPRSSLLIYKTVRTGSPGGRLFRAGAPQKCQVAPSRQLCRTPSSPHQFHGFCSKTYVKSDHLFRAAVLRGSPLQPSLTAQPEPPSKGALDLSLSSCFTPAGVTATPSHPDPQAPRTPGTTPQPCPLSSQASRAVSPRAAGGQLLSPFRICSGGSLGAASPNPGGSLSSPVTSFT